MTNPLRTLLLLLGPSFSGKTALIDKLVTEYPKRFVAVLSYTTRPRRGPEDDKTYIFVDEEWFKANVINGDSPNYVLSGDGYYYGNTREQIEAPLREGKIPVFAVYEDGVTNFRNAGYDTLCVVIEPINRGPEHKRPGRDAVDERRSSLPRQMRWFTLQNDFAEPLGLSLTYQILKAGLGSLLN